VYNIIIVGLAMIVLSKDRHDCLYRCRVAANEEAIESRVPNG
jgi:hypothetical protein